MRFINHLSILLVALGLAAHAGAQLKWEQKEIEVHPSVTDDAAVGHFNYENIGPKPVHIASVKTSCGCTVATLKSNDVAPGAKGEITATLKIGDRIGMQYKTVTVITDDVAQPTLLTLKVVIPQLLEVQPVVLFWNPNDPLAAKVVTIKAPGDSPVTNVTVTSSAPEITAEVKPGDGPKEWKISVLPKNVTRTVAGSLTIQPQYPVKTPKLYYVGIHVQAHPAP
jgi:Protein of unknown function (DUF1573)